MASLLEKVKQNAVPQLNTAVSPSGSILQKASLASAGTPTASAKPDFSSAVSALKNRTSKETTATDAFSHAAAYGVAPSVAGLAAGVQGAAAGSVLGPVGSIVGGLVAGIGASILTAKAQDEALKVIKGNEWMQKEQEKLAQGREQHPIASFAGEVVPQLAALKPSPSTVVRAAKTAQQILTTGEKARAFLQTPAAKKGIEDLINVSLGSGTSVAGEVYDQAKNGDYDAIRIIAAGTIGALINQPNRFGVKLGMTASGDTRIAPDYTPEQQSALAKIQSSIKEDAVTHTNEDVVTSVNPTGGMYAEYAPQVRAEAPLGDNITTYAETAKINPDELVTVYRGAPSTQEKIVPGDFITTNKQLAEDYAGTGKVLEEQVPARDILDDSTEPLGEEYIYRPQIKEAKDAHIKVCVNCLDEAEKVVAQGAADKVERGIYVPEAKNKDEALEIARNFYESNKMNLDRLGKNTHAWALDAQGNVIDSHRGGRDGVGSSQPVQDAYKYVSEDEIKNAISEQTIHKTEDGKKISKLAERINEQLPSDSRVNEYYDPTTIKRELTKAAEEIEKNPEKALNNAMDTAKPLSGRLAKIMEFAESARNRGDTQTQSALLAKMRVMGTETGQALNMFKAFGFVNPETQFMMDIVSARLGKVKIDAEDIARAGNRVSATREKVYGTTRKSVEKATQNAFTDADMNALLGSLIC